VNVPSSLRGQIGWSAGIVCPDAVLVGGAQKDTLLFLSRFVFAMSVCLGTRVAILRHDVS